MNFDRFEIDKTAERYLRGESFASSYKFETGAQVSDLVDRFRMLTELARAKKILHIGCCDHLGLIDEKIEQGKWLHKLLHESGSEVVGVDIDKEAINYINERYPQYTVKYANITESLPEFLSAGGFDYVFLPETLEHIASPGIFLSKLHENCQAISKELIITVPNAFKKSNRQNGKHYELINTDHYFWFTPYTLAKSLLGAGFKMKWFTYAMYGRRTSTMNPLTLLRNRYLRQNPSAQDIIVMCCEF
ncbi:MAG: class I SAM-dependent methyltransferase [Candidatus Cloacimonetes bacterium]|nr:class I SAM-dependent methyltransferase [Candidatus Cloacimonadota bacterium]